jgi:hypothetical protein
MRFPTRCVSGRQKPVMGLTNTQGCAVVPTGLSSCFASRNSIGRVLLFCSVAVDPSRARGTLDPGHDPHFSLTVSLRMCAAGESLITGCRR